MLPIMVAENKYTPRAACPLRANFEWVCLPMALTFEIGTKHDSHGMLIQEIHYESKL